MLSNNAKDGMTSDQYESAQFEINIIKAKNIKKSLSPL